MVKTLADVIIVAEMLVFRGMIKLEEEGHMEDEFLDTNFNVKLTQFIEKLTKKEIKQMLTEYGMRKAVALWLRKGKPLTSMNHEVILHEVLKEGVSKSMSLEKFKLFKVWAVDVGMEME
jgi:hypothetical protein